MILILTNYLFTAWFSQKKKSYKDLVLYKRGLVARREENEARAVVINVVVDEEEEGNDEEDVDVTPSFEIRKVPKKIERRIEREERAAERKKNKRRPIDLSHYWWIW